MDYIQTLEYIHAAPRFKGTNAPRRMARLCALLGDPHKQLKFVHVAGTNGKGSTCAMIAGALQAAGYRTGLFISPYITDFRERMQIDGARISREALCAVADRVRAADETLAREGQNVTEFELVTACGLCWFLQERCDVVVLEVGLGGQFDATNVIPRSEVAVLTKIALDHTKILGETLTEIAGEKCGILKGGVAVSYPRQAEEALTAILERCAAQGTVLRLPAAHAAEIVECSLTRCVFRYAGEVYTVPLGGRHQIDNALTALEALDALRDRGFQLPAEAVRRGFEAVRFPARLECVCASPRVFIDGAHNPDGMTALAAALEGTRFTAIFAAMKDKDFTQTVRLIAARARRLITTTLPMPRAAMPEELAEAARGYCGEVLCAPSFDAAWGLARAGLGPDEAVVICGSLYLAGEARALLCPAPPKEG